MPGIQLSGLATGLDTDAIIGQLLASEKAPRTQMVNQQGALQARQRVLTDVTTKLRALADAATRLGSTTTWHNVQTVDSTDAGKVSARQLGPAAPGGYSVSVTQLATADQHSYSYTPPASDDTLTIGSKTVAIPANATLDDVVSAVNDDTSLGVIAVAVDGGASGRTLTLVSRTTGTAAAFTASAASLTEDPLRARPAHDAQFTIDGGDPQTSATNVVANAIPGVELTLRAAGSSATVTVTSPQLDTSGATDAVRAFVTAYNAVVDTVRGALTDKPVPRPKTAADAAKGTLYSDPALSALLNKLRTTLTQAFPDGGAGGTAADLSTIGISTGKATGAMTSADALAGRLTLDATAFGAALDADPSRIRQLLSGTSGDGGLAKALRDTFSSYTDTGGVLDSRIRASGDGVRSINDRIAAFDDRMTRRETLLRRQFTAMETAVARSRAQGQDLMNRLGIKTSS